MEIIDRIYTRKQVSEITGLPKSNLYRLMREGQFPRPVQLGPRRVGWKASAIQQWIEQLSAAE